MKVFRTHLSIQPKVTSIMCVPTLLVELLPHSTKVAAQIFAKQIMAKMREENQERNLGPGTLILLYLRFSL